MKSFNTFGVGATGAAAGERTLAAMPNGIVSVRELAVPEGANPSKLGTWIQRAALDNAVPDDCPDNLRAYVVQAAALLDDPNLALAIDMTGNPAGEKMAARLGAGEHDHPYLVFGLTAG
jgi:hypothetical protein